MNLTTKYNTRAHLQQNQNSQKLFMFIETDDKNSQKVILGDRIQIFNERMKCLKFYKKYIYFVVTTYLKYEDLSSFKSQDVHLIIET